MPCCFIAATRRQARSISSGSTSVIFEPGFLAENEPCMRTMLTPSFARKRAWYARSASDFVYTVSPTAQKRTGVPSPRRKPLPSAFSRTNPLSPATFSLSERRSNSASSLKASLAGSNAHVLAASKRTAFSPPARSMPLGVNGSLDRTITSRPPWFWAALWNLNRSVCAPLSRVSLPTSIQATKRRSGLPSAAMLTTSRAFLSILSMSVHGPSSSL